VAVETVVGDLEAAVKAEEAGRVVKRVAGKTAAAKVEDTEGGLEVVEAAEEEVAKESLHGSSCRTSN